MKKIKLTQGKYALVDDKDFKNLIKYNWCALKHGISFYAVHNFVKNKHRKIITMQNFLMKTPKGMVTDHIDGNGLNNQRKNLRICSNQENLMNRGKQKNNISGFKGVYWKKDSKKWCATIRLNGKTIYLGTYTDKLKAYEIYCEACKKYHGKFAKTI